MSTEAVQVVAARRAQLHPLNRGAYDLGQLIRNDYYVWRVTQADWMLSEPLEVSFDEDGMRFAVTVSYEGDQLQDTRANRSHVSTGVGQGSLYLSQEIIATRTLPITVDRELNGVRLQASVTYVADVIGTVVSSKS